MAILWLYMPVFMIVLLEISRACPRPCRVGRERMSACGLFGPMFYHDPVNRNDMHAVESRLHGDIAESETRLREEIRMTRYCGMIWQGALTLALGVVMAWGFGWLGF